MCAATCFAARLMSYELISYPLTHTHGWLLGSVAMGLLYDKSRTGLLIFAMLAQLASLPFFWIAQRHVVGEGHA